MRALKGRKAVGLLCGNGAGARLNPMSSGSPCGSIRRSLVAFRPNSKEVCKFV